MAKWKISIEMTPNPEAMKFVANGSIAAETRSFNSAAESHSSPLAQKLFGFPWAKAVLIGPDFVSIVKQDWVDWKVLAEPLAQLLEEHLERGEGVLLEAAAPTSTSEDSPIVAQIKRLLDTEIRPAVAMDGGDILFQRFEDGKVYLHMHGSCSGCPSAALTLKDGVEMRLKEAFPEIQEVIAV